MNEKGKHQRFPWLSLGSGDWKDSELFFEKTELIPSLQPIESLMHVLVGILQVVYNYAKEGATV
jgi:hypothetical protein